MLLHFAGSAWPVKEVQQSATQFDKNKGSKTLHA